VAMLAMAWWVQGEDEWGARKGQQLSEAVQEQLLLATAKPTGACAP
jgi:hypothetical protein